MSIGVVSGLEVSLEVDAEEGGSTVRGKAGLEGRMWEV